MVQQSFIDEQIRDYLLQQARIDKARRQPVSSFRQERRKWERRLGYFMLGGVAVLVFALNEYFHNKSGQVVLIVLGGEALAFLGALIYVHGVLWVTGRLGYRAELRSFELTMASTGIVFFALWALAYAVMRGGDRATLPKDVESRQARMEETNGKPPMADYYSVIASAVCRMSSKTDEARHAGYELSACE